MQPLQAIQLLLPNLSHFLSKLPIGIILLSSHLSPSQIKRSKGKDCCFFIREKKEAKRFAFRSSFPGFP
jgi:hypothetical protein